MKKRVQLAMLLGTFALTVVSCDKDDNQLEIKKETKVNNYDEDELEKDWGLPPIKPPKKLKSSLNNEEEVDKDWGLPPIKPPTKLKSNFNNDQEQIDHDWGLPPIKPPKK
ncbi:hypothetical protein [Myroides sp.]|uniref:hypothetical protein n=1 Tax=Myroides sp. TaxID=1874736 RepID=UPI003F39920D